MNFIKTIITVVLVMATLLVMNIGVVAHPIMLNINYDPCIPNTYSNGEDEMWYALRTYIEDETHPENNYYLESHIDESVTTIRYYFANNAKDDESYT